MPLRLLPAILVILSLAPTALAQHGQEADQFGTVIQSSRTTLIEQDGNGRRARAIPVANSPYAKFTNPA
jgi:hypothetical protein